jgi:hypothetical protein
MAGMDDLKRLEAKGLARAKIRARRRRVSSIRGRTIRGALALFALAWAILFAQLVTGNDPALSRAGSARRAVAAAGHTHERPRSQPVESPEVEEPEAVVPVEEEAVPVEEEVVPIEEEAAPEVEEPEPEFAPEPEPEPAPVITASS